MIVKQDLDFYDLKDLCWSGASDTLDKVYEANKQDELMELLEELFTEPTLTEINDFLWFDSDTVFDSLGIKDDEEEDSEEEDDEEF